jgi:hypothetical protein
LELAARLPENDVFRNHTMRIDEVAPELGRVIDSLNEALHYADLQGRDGLACRVWKNPSQREFANAIRSSSDGVAAGLRGLLTATDLYTWQSMNFLHADFERESGMQGVRVTLRAGAIRLNDETIALPEHFPWIFPDAAKAAEMDNDEKLAVVTGWQISGFRESIRKASLSSDISDMAETESTDERSARRWELRSLLTMAICGTPDITMTLEARPSKCVCKETGRPVSDHIPRCLDCLGKADAALRLLDQLEQQEK